MLARALDVIFPQRCAGCGAGPWPFCDPCRSSLKALRPPWCRRCGRPKAMSVPRCRDCPPPEIDTARAPFRFEGPARQADPPVEVLGVARRGFGAVVGDGRGRRAAERRGGDLGAARTATTRRARVRPGARPGHGRGTPNGDALRWPAHQGSVHRAAGQTRCGRSQDGDARGVRGGGSRRGAVIGAGGRRRPDDGRHGSRCGAGAAAGWSHLGAPAGSRSSIFLSVLRGEA